MSRGTRDIERGGERKTGGGTICHMRKFMHVSALIPQCDMNGGGEGLLYIMCLAARVCVCVCRQGCLVCVHSLERIVHQEWNARPTNDVHQPLAAPIHVILWN